MTANVASAAPTALSGPGPASSWRQVLLFTRQSLLDPHRGSAFGFAWLLLLPLVQILIYTLVFSRFMGARLGSVASPFAYSLYLVPGLLLWTAFANTVTGMAQVYATRAQIIRKIPVDLVRMPAYVPLVELCLWGLAMLLFVLFCVGVGHQPTLAWLLLPWLCATTLLLAYGIGLVLAALAQFAPDVRQLTGIVLQLGFWVTPVVYLVDILPPWLAAVMKFHPVYWSIAPAQHIVLYGAPASWTPMLWQLGAGLLALAAGSALVRRLEKDIRDLL
ncbi:MAG TPA: ABC transporter permease [Ramlibacter sp.]|nr:ABC transporter permease [Ramlibacter sp.]